MSPERIESRRVVVVTGAARGIGFGIAQRLALEGTTVALLDRDAPALNEAVAELKRGGAQALGVKVDLTDSIAVNAAFDEILATTKPRLGSGDRYQSALPVPVLPRRVARDG